jgi:hypothetical protein
MSVATQVLLIIAIVCAFSEAGALWLPLGPRPNLGWLAVALYLLSLVVR